ncbi:uncharacterized protein Dmul_15100 [Desulfococcus multivorans]|nr:uncharacterized protein Dmul_15100 [Desulfococcus multivorans]
MPLLTSDQSQFQRIIPGPLRKRCPASPGAMVLGTPRSSKPSASSQKRGGASIPLAPSISRGS